MLENFKTFAQSLRVRLTAWNTTVVLLTVIVTLLGLRAGLRLTLVNETDTLLLDDANEVALTVEQFYPTMETIYSAMHRKAATHADRGLFLALLAPDGTRLWSSSQTPQVDRLQPTSAQAGAFDSGSYRLVRQQMAKPDIPAYILLVGSPLSLIEQDVARLTPVMILAVAAVLCVAPLGGYWLARRATSPIARIITTAARLRPSCMDERLPIRGTGDELDRLSSTINRFLDLIADHLARNRDFVANAAHELRSPLAAIRSSLEVTLNSQRSPEEYQELLSEIADQCETLSTLVNQLLLLAETDAPRFQIQRQPVRLDRLVERAVDMFRGAAEERGIQLTAECPPGLTVPADANRLRQVINNLIDNSLKYTPPGGSVDLRAAPGELGQIDLSVSDSGPGVPGDDLPHVFERFYRGDKSRQRANATTGNGLGLSICQSIVAAHGGTIRAANKPDGGAIFTVHLPTSARQLSEAPESRLSYSGRDAEPGG